MRSLGNNNPTLAGDVTGTAQASVVSTVNKEKAATVAAAIALHLYANYK